MPRALVPLVEGVEEIEAVTVIDVLRRAGVEVVAAGLKPGPVTAARGTRLLPDAELDQVAGQAFDLVALPGGPGTKALREDPRILDLARRQAAAGRLLGAVCAAPSVLGAAGLLKGRKVSAYPGSMDGPWGEGVTPLAVPAAVDGAIVTGRSAGAAMEWALALVEALLGKDKRSEVERALLR